MIKEMLKHSRFSRYIPALLAVSLLFLSNSCRRDVDELEPARFPKTAEVFIDDFSAGLQYAVFAGAKPTAFEVDSDVRYAGSQSMRFEVPDAQDPEGAYAGGTFFTTVGRDLTGYTALTFWAKSTRAATIDVIGFGNDLGENKYLATLNGVKVNTNWKKFIIPIPDPSKLTEEKGMLYYSEGPEEGTGYTFWLDEVKFEKLETIAHPKPAIFEQEDQVIQAETGDELTIGGTFVEFNLPTGINQRVDASPAYYSFETSNSSVATVDESGIVSVVDSGRAVITAKLLDIEATGSLTVDGVGALPGPQTAAPVPTVNPDSVISMFSNAYTDVPIDTWNTGWQFSTAKLEDIQIEGDDVKQYKDLNFVGIEFASQTIDASGMTHFHLDIWTPDPTGLPAAFNVLLVDFGADGAFDGGDDSSHELSFTSPTLQTGEWVSLDIPLVNFTELVNRAHLAQLVLSGDLPTVFVDNVYFYNDGGGSTGSGPTDPAPTPTRDAADVISVFSDAYTDLADTDFNPDWGQSTVVTFEDIMGNSTLKYASFNYQGTQLSAPVDASAMMFLHIDMWTADATNVQATPISIGTGEALVSLEPIVPGQWNSYDIPLSAFTDAGVSLADLHQLKFDGQAGATPSTIYLDNIYFYQEGGTSMEPTSPAPTPTQDAADVISVFSDAYTDLADTDFNPDWGQSTVVTFEDIMGNSTLKYASFNYQGTQLSAPVDASAMMFLHIDMWTADATNVQATPISIGTGEALVSLEPIVPGQWNSYDIPLSAFTDAGVSLADLHQLKFDGQAGVTPSTIYLDNIYFYQEGGMVTGPTQPAPTPSLDEADVISLFSDAYTDVTVDTWRTDWSSATFEDISVEGNATKKYSELDFVGIETVASTIDATDMTHFHLDVWSDDFTFFGIKLVDFGADGVFGGGDDVEHQVNFEAPMRGGWLSLDIPLEEFAGLTTRAHMAQYILVGQPIGATTVYIDNMYFHK